MALLEIDGLSVVIGNTPILNAVSFNVEAGSVVGLVGESGSGKSMTALSVIGLLPEGARQAGHIRLAGEELTTMTEVQWCALRGKDIGLIFQEPMSALNPLLSIGAQVAETVRLHRRVSRADADAIARQALVRVGLPPEQVAPERHPHELSGGQRQRVAIAIAIAMAPRVLLADEPTTALDVTTQAQILDLLVRLAREDGAALVLITHDLAVLARTADRVVVLKDGSVVEQGATIDVLRAPQHGYTRALLADSRYVSKHASRDRRAAPAVLEVQAVVREYRRPRRGLFTPRQTLRAVDRVSLTLHAGESVGLVGESGSGKSSLLRTILALDPVQSGAVILHGQTFSQTRSSRPTSQQMRSLRRRIQVVFQDPFGSFDPHWRVEQIIAEPLHLLDTAPGARERRRKIDAVLERVGLRSMDADKYPHEFSGGQRQRIAIARALIVEPDVIALDEAVSALDVTIRARILDLLADIAHQQDVAYLFVSHDLSVVRAITDRVYVMRAGRIVEEGATADVFSAPRHPYTVELLAATPRLEPPAPHGPL